MSVGELLNQPMSLGLDAQTVRSALVLMIAVTCWQWPQDLRRYWTTWTRRGRRVTSWMLVVIVMNGLAVWAAASRDDPLRLSTWLLAFGFFGLNAAMLIRFANDDTTHRQYVHLADRLLRRA